MANTTVAIVNTDLQASYILAVITELPPDDLLAMKTFLTVPIHTKTYAN